MLEQIQYRMAEVIFRPIRVLRACWAEGRKTSNHYMLAGWTVFLPALGFGIMLGKGLSSEAFRFDAEPSLIGNIGLSFVLVWLVFTFYAGLMAAVTGLIGTLRN